MHFIIAEIVSVLVEKNVQQSMLLSLDSAAAKCLRSSEIRKDFSVVARQARCGPKLRVGED